MRALALVALLLAAALPAHAQEADDAPSGYVATVRLTHYVHGGITYGGGHTYIGSAACSWNFPLYTRFTLLATGETFICNDRGLLGSSGWLDLYGVNRDYLGAYADVWVE